MAANSLLAKQYAAILDNQAAVLEKYIGVVDIAAALQLDRRSIRRLILRGKFPPADLRVSATCNRWKLSTVENWLAEHAQGAR
jgi:predicted DNA-binding transcriptional regulator AlpA